MVVRRKAGTGGSAEDAHARGQARVDAADQGGIERLDPFRLQLYHLAGALDADGQGRRRGRRAAWDGTSRAL